MKKIFLVSTLLFATSLNISTASATPYTSLVIENIQSALTGTSAELKAWLASELKIEESLGEIYISQINRANQDPATAAAVQVSIKAAWAVDIAGIDSIYEPYEFQLVAQIALAKDSLLAAKRASKNPATFDTAFATALSFEYNRTSLQKIISAPWTGSLKAPTINTLAKVKLLAKSFDSIAKSYSLSSASKLNSLAGASFTNRAEFKTKLGDAKALYSAISP